MEEKEKIERKEKEGCRRFNMRERKIRWRLEEIARKKERKGNSVERIWEAEYNWAMVEIK